MDQKYIIFETQPTGQLENIAYQLKQNKLVCEIQQKACGLIITYAGNYQQFKEDIGTLPENIHAESLGTIKKH